MADFPQGVAPHPSDPVDPDSANDSQDAQGVRATLENNQIHEPGPGDVALFNHKGETFHAPPELANQLVESGQATAFLFAVKV